MKRYCLKTLKNALYAIVVGLVAYLLVGCKVIKEVPVETVRYEQVHDTTRIVLCEYDSIYVQDSVAIERYKDSVDKYYQSHIEWRLRYVHNTVEKVKEIHDSTRVEVPVNVEVEKELTAWESFCLNLGKWTWWFWILLLLVGILWVVKKVYFRR